MARGKTTNINIRGINADTYREFKFICLAKKVSVTERIRQLILRELDEWVKEDREYMAWKKKLTRPNRR